MLSFGVLSAQWLPVLFLRQQFGKVAVRSICVRVRAEFELCAGEGARVPIGCGGLTGMQVINGKTRNVASTAHTGF